MIAIQRFKARTRLVNPQGKTKRTRTRTTSGRAAKTRTRTRRNPAELITLGAIVNPQRGTAMKKAKKRNPAKKAARRRNPVTIYKAAPARKRRNGTSRRRRNPSIIGTSKEMIRSGAYALAGMVIARQAPQMLLKEKNTGVMGYLSNAAAAVAAAFAAGKFAGEKAANDVLIGGGLYLVNRVLTEQFTQAGKLLSMSGVGDAQASATLGRVYPGAYPLPVARDASGRVVIPPAYAEAMAKALPAAPAKPTVNTVAGVARSIAPKF